MSTTSGDIELKIPKLRAGSFFPALLERRRRIAKALHAVIMQAYVHGVSTRSVDDLVAALGVDWGSPSPRSPASAPVNHTQLLYVFASFCPAPMPAA